MSSLDFFISRYGEEEGRNRYVARGAKISKSRKCEPWACFIRAPDVIATLEHMEVTENHKELVNNFFSQRPWKKHRHLSKMLAIWITQGIVDWENRYAKLLEIGITKQVREAFILRFGETLGDRKFEESCHARTAHFMNKTEYWISRGLTESQAQEKVKDIQRYRNAKAQDARQRNLPKWKEENPRCIEYWLARDLTFEQAQKMLSLYQTRNLPYFIEKYGADLGPIKYQESVCRRQQTWLTKDKIEHAMATTPIAYNPNGMEMRAIKSFLAYNGIDTKHCKFGSPKNQFWQMIPGTGFRRYDLAVFADESHEQLKLILEFHGPAHINFSEYTDAMKDVPITINGKHLWNLGTYGEAYNNDMIKRQHILKHYPNVIYLVMWSQDLQEKRLGIDELQ
jgi:hypothetical protein